jgi:hypothetical protein
MFSGIECQIECQPPAARPRGPLAASGGRTTYLRERPSSYQEAPVDDVTRERQSDGRDHR